MQEKKRRSQLFQPLVIFQRLFSFIIDNLIPRGFKHEITTSHSLRQISNSVPMVSAKPGVKWVELQQACNGPSQAQIHEAAQIHEHIIEEKITFVGSNDNDNNSKTVSNFEEEERIRKMKGKSVCSSEMLTPVVERQEVKLPNLPLRQRQVRPLFDVAVNINEKSDAFIRSRKEAMRRNYSSEAETYLI